MSAAFRARLEEVKEALRHEIPNVALGPLRWNTSKVRSDYEARLEALADQRRVAAEGRRRRFGKRRAKILARQKKEREAAMLASRSYQPKKIGALRASVDNLRRLDRRECADKKEEQLRRMEEDYWRNVSGTRFEEKAKEELDSLQAEELEAEIEDERAYDQRMRTVRLEMDAAVDASRRSNRKSVDEKVWKAAHFSASGNVEKLEELLKRRGTEAAEERDGDTSWTPLFFAAQSGNIECAKLLLEYDADVMARDPKSRTALHIAAAYSSREVAALLLEHGKLTHQIRFFIRVAGADIDAVDQNGKRPFDVAKDRDRSDPLVRFLQDFIVPGGRRRSSIKKVDEVPEEETNLIDDPALTDALTKLHIKEKAFGEYHEGLIPTLNEVARIYRNSFGDARRARGQCYLFARAYNAQMRSRESCSSQRKFMVIPA